MNRNYAYPGFSDWESAGQNIPPCALERLVRAIGEAPEARGGVDALPEFSADPEEVRSRPGYHYKTGCLDDPDTVRALNARGLHYETLEMGATRGIVLTPLRNLETRERKLPVVISFHREDYSDPFWAMKTLRLYAGAIDTLAEKRDRTQLVIVTNRAPARSFANMLSDCVQNFCGDRDRVYIDLSLLRGRSLREIPGFSCPDAQDRLLSDPDGCVELLDGETPVLNFGGRWAVPWRPAPLDAAGDGTLDAAWLYHSEFGRKMLERRRFCLRYASPEDPELRALWAEMGLSLHIGHVRGERYALFLPTQTPAKPLPVMVCLHEVGEPDDHGIVTGFAEFREYCVLAGQGECAVLFFALESPRGNECIADILRESAAALPLDLSRVYLTGHSHNGHFAQEFARRHPELVAGIAPLGNSPGLPTQAVSHEAVVVTDEMAARMERMDMPTCIFCGCCEVGGLVPVNRTAHAFEAGINVEGYAASAEGKMAMWNRRLRAERCPEQSTAALLECAESCDPAVRALGFPADRTETRLVDGFEHYIGDVRNTEGKYHFRVVAIENMPHRIVPSMHELAWNYLRRFARDPATGAVIELW